MVYLVTVSGIIVYLMSHNTSDIRIYSMIRCANSNIESSNHRITESSNHERIGKYSLYRIIESPNSESWRIFLIFDLSNIESPNHRIIEPPNHRITENAKCQNVKMPKCQKQLQNVKNVKMSKILKCKHEK